MNELLDEMELALSDLLQAGLASAGPEAAGRLRTLARQGEQAGLHTGYLYEMTDIGQVRAAMEAISDSVQIVGNKPYVRVYERGEDGKFAAISMDMAAV